MKRVVVVEDSDEAIALYLAADTVVKKPVHGSDGTEIDRALSYSQRFALACLGLDVPRLVREPPGTPCANPDRVRHGGSRAVVIEPDLSAWEWKDEEELEDAIRVGRFTASDARRIRAEGKKALDALNSRAWPFDGRWDEWRPDAMKAVVVASRTTTFDWAFQSVFRPATTAQNGQT